MFSSVLLAGLLTASTLASPTPIEAPVSPNPAALVPREDRKYCDASIVNAETPNNFCYQWCDIEPNKLIVGEPIQVSNSVRCTTGPDDGCAITVLNQETIESSTTVTHGTTDVSEWSVGGNVGGPFGGVSLSHSWAHWIEQSTATMEGKQTTKATTSWMYVPKGKNGHVVFFPFYEMHCGPATVLRKPSLQDEKDFDCNPDYNHIIKNGGKTDGIRGMQYKWDGIGDDKIYDYHHTCIRLPTAFDNGEAKGRYQMCITGDPDKECVECKDCNPNEA